jgi:voltage-gated potassium channel
MTAQAPVLRQHGNAYNIFILVLTVYSLAMMVLLILPLDENTHFLVNVYDNLICVVFLIDFAYNLTGATPKRAYFISGRGWLDLIGSIPTFGILRFTALLRLARLSRLARITRLLGGQAGKDLVIDVLRNRSQYATFITILLAGMVLSTASIIVLEAESGAKGANITTGGDAIWWGIVTITTVGYGDYYPVTALGRLTAVFVMFAGIGIIGALASILASLLVSPSSTDEPEPEADAASTTVAVAPGPQVDDAAGASTLARELAGLRSEIAGQRAEIAALRATLGAGGAGGAG